MLDESSMQQGPYSETRVTRKKKPEFLALQIESPVRHLLKDVVIL